MPKKTTTAPRYVTEGRAQELVDEVVRKALREQARDLETHLRNIHKRLVSLEKK
jgi:rubrerythrin